MAALLELDGVQGAQAGPFQLSVDALRVEAGQVLAVIGPNGAGKSTLLMTIGGLLPALRGRILHQGAVVDPYRSLEFRRQVAVVMQAPLLLQGSVASNVAAGMRFRGLANRDIQPRVQLWLERLGILHLADRPASRLSGGEAQRVSLARALVLQPSLLLLDEPFSALDAPTRQRFLEDLHGLLRETGLTTLFVTHDLDEALFLGDQVAVMMAGQIRQIGTPQDVFTAPTDPEVAAFVGIETVLHGTVAAQEDGLLAVESGGMRFQAVGEAQPGQQVLLCLRPEDITLLPATAQAPSSARNRMPGRVARMLPQGPLWKVVVEGPATIVALITRPSARELGLQEGAPVVASFKATAVHVIPR